MFCLSVDLDRNQYVPRGASGVVAGSLTDALPLEGDSRSRLSECVIECCLALRAPLSDDSFGADRRFPRVVATFRPARDGEAGSVEGLGQGGAAGLVARLLRQRPPALAAFYEWVCRWGAPAVVGDLYCRAAVVVGFGGHFDPGGAGNPGVLVDRLEYLLVRLDCLQRLPFGVGAG